MQWHDSRPPAYQHVFGSACTEKLILLHPPCNHGAVRGAVPILTATIGKRNLTSLHLDPQWLGQNLAMSRHKKQQCGICYRVTACRHEQFDTCARCHLPVCVGSNDNEDIAEWCGVWCDICDEWLCQMCYECKTPNQEHCYSCMQKRIQCDNCQRSRPHTRIIRIPNRDYKVCVACVVQYDQNQQVDWGEELV